MPPRKLASPTIAPVAQRFGGPWSLIKTDIVEKYLNFFNVALKNKPFERVYIDAFAGSGAFHYISRAPEMTLFGSPDEKKEIHAGSAKRALLIQPPFARIYFIEKRSSNVKALEALIRKSKHPSATVDRGDANRVLRKLCRPEDWRKRRGVIFLDPFGMNVEWATLKMIAATEALDVWFLFALGGIIRNLPRRADRLDDWKRAAVTRVLGTDEWLTKFYKAPRAPQRTLWETHATRAPAQRTATVDDIEDYVHKRLRSIFPHVESPKRLEARHKPLFSLFFAVSNPSRVAIKLARKGAAYILENA